MIAGVLALQGAFREHEDIMHRLGCETKQIRQLKDLTDDLSGLIFPGGESTAIGKLLRDLGLFGPVKEKIENGFPVYGTCAGMILLAKKISNDSKVHLGTMDICVERNAYGRQLGSFFTESGFAGYENVKMPFIRAPYVASAGKGVEILSEVDGRIVAARQKNQLVTAFHPELTDDTRVHGYFMDMMKNA